MGIVAPENKGSALGSYGFEAMNGAFYKTIVGLNLPNGSLITE